MRSATPQKLRSGNAASHQELLEHRVQQVGHVETSRRRKFAPGIAAGSWQGSIEPLPVRRLRLCWRGQRIGLRVGRPAERARQFSSSSHSMRKFAYPHDRGCGNDLRIGENKSSPIEVSSSALEGAPFSERAFSWLRLRLHWQRLVRLLRSDPRLISLCAVLARGVRRRAASALSAARLACARRSGGKSGLSADISDRNGSLAR